MFLIKSGKCCLIMNSSVCFISSLPTLRLPQLKWGLTFNNFTQPQSISHFSSTRPRWEVLKRDGNSKLLLQQSQSESHWVTLGQWHPHTHARTHAVTHAQVRALYYQNFTNNWQNVLVKFVHVNTSSSEKKKKLLNILLFPSRPFKSGLSQGNNRRNARPLEPVSGAIERLAAGSDAVN